MAMEKKVANETARQDNGGIYLKKTRKILLISV